MRAQPLKASLGWGVCLETRKAPILVRNEQTIQATASLFGFAVCNRPEPNKHSIQTRQVDPEGIIKSAGDKLEACGLKRELSAQAKAVVEAICEVLNDQDAQPLVLVRQADAVKQTPTGRMKKPTLDEVLEQCRKIELPEEQGLKYFDYYESKGWKVGKEPMKLWTAALANWKRTWQERNGNGHVSPSVEAIRNQTALARVEDRLKAIRGMFPLPKDDPTRVEFQMLKTERVRLMNAIGFKA